MTGNCAWRASATSLDGVSLASLARDGDMPVLMVHGIGPGTTGWLNFSCLADLLLPRCAIHMVDLAGFGASGRLPWPPYFDVSFWLRQLELVVDDILTTHGKPPLVIGNSAGGALALKLAARRPELRRVVAAAVPCGPPNALLRAFWRSPCDAPGLADAMRPMTARYDEPDPELLRARLSPFLAGDYGAYFDDMLADPAACMQSLALAEVEAAAIAADILLLHGRADRACPMGAMMSGLLPLLPAADLVLMGAAGHNVCTERAADVARLVNHLLEEVSIP
jgi:pimeloyl-ACP methyl ester carboxylesterase